MLYFYLFLCIVLLVAVTIYYFRSLKSSGVPANAQLIIDAWNSVAGGVPIPIRSTKNVNWKTTALAGFCSK